MRKRIEADLGRRQNREPVCERRSLLSVNSLGPKGQFARGDGPEKRVRPYGGRFHPFAQPSGCPVASFGHHGVQSSWVGNCTAERAEEPYVGRTNGGEGPAGRHIQPGAKSLEVMRLTGNRAGFDVHGAPTRAVASFGLVRIGYGREGPMVHEGRTPFFLGGLEGYVAVDIFFVAVGLMRKSRDPVVP